MLLNQQTSGPDIPTAPTFFGNREEVISLPRGFQIVLGDFYLNSKKDFYFLTSEDVCEFVFVLSGEFRNSLSGAGDIIVKPLFSALWLTPVLKGHHQCLPDKNIKFVCIRIARTLLAELSGEFLLEVPDNFRRVLEKKEDSLFYRFSKMNIQMQSAARQIFDCPYQGSMKKIFLESKALELISHFMTLQFGNNPKRDDSLPAKEKANIEYARDVLIENMENPLSLPELAKKAGLSETKLTRGFRRLYGTSVFEYLRNQRMEKAKMLLESGDLNVTEISYIIGYSSPAHFTRVFTKHFGSNPKNFLHSFKKADSYFVKSRQAN